ncbi:MAG: 16S rRNA (cytosine(1402)-N(4))-methyltransferase RsmH [Spirochaetales bacterium]|jgi:16S rRNA (cytosine1402-N4)-methyltransferase|nr:16S rRNA (cytosine(1402)-N(4))-methyltransferase RsmH [Spirochaetales bacterium]
MEIVHTSVMVEEALRYLRPDKEDALFLDGTLGEGGHCEAMLSCFPRLRAVGVDADPVILDRARERLLPFGDRFRGVNAWSDDFLRDYPLNEPPDRILLDLGISVFHYSRSGRGFSFTAEEPLDMRLSDEGGESAADILASRDEKTLADIFFTLGGERYSRRIARGVVRRRAEKHIGSAKEFAEIIWNAVPASYRHGRIHPATRSFQALRIAVNRELERLDRVLPLALDILPGGGRLGVIAFHSLEDRRVKTFFREKSRAGVVNLLTRKAARPGEEERRRNSPSRSARFRAAEKLAAGSGPGKGGARCPE